MVRTVSSMPRVSVAMCTFNGARFLHDQLDSIAAQTVPPFELVVQDDGSTDETAQIVTDFARGASFPVHFFRNADRLGPFANFGTCMLRCQGEVIALSDQDDVWAIDRIARTAEAFASNPRLTFTFSDAPLIDDTGKALGRTIFETVPVTRRDRRLLSQGEHLGPLLLRYSVLYGATMAARTDLVRQVLPLPDGWGQDDWLAVALSSLGPSARLAPVTSYRQHAAQVVGAGSGGIRAGISAMHKRDAAVYRQELDRYDAAIAAVRTRSVFPASLLQRLEQRRSFLRRRHELRSGGLTIASVSQLTAMIPAYWTFAAGARSIVKDVMVMSRGRVVA